MEQAGEGKTDSKASALDKAIQDSRVRRMVRGEGSACEGGGGGGGGGGRGGNLQAVSDFRRRDEDELMDHSLSDDASWSSNGQVKRRHQVSQIQTSSASKRDVRRCE